MAKLLNQIKDSTTRVSRWEKLCKELNNEEDIADLKTALADDTVQTNAIVRVLRARGIVVDKSTIATWRREGNYES